MLRIGGVKIESPVALAPMAGVTDSVFRAIARKMGVGLVFTEMVSSRGLLYNNERTRELVTFAEEERPLAMQLFGSEPKLMGKAAKFLADLQPDFIDINMGCPTPKIVKNGDGAALMLDPDRAAQVVESVARSSTCPVTVKMRRGWDETSPSAVELAPLLVRAGAQGLAIHGRYREQFYRGKANWECIAAVKARVSVPVWGNGDVKSADTALELLQRTGCDGVMIGRGALGNPWLLREIDHYLRHGEYLPRPSLGERADLALLHLNQLAALRGEYMAVRTMRPQLAWYTKGFPQAAVLRQQLNRAESIAEVEDLLQNSIQLVQS
ncbi:MAG: tRNA dihydrouridine synthase DusB [Firmicutes bacterium]|nr:tRNA dihydrouridine synthase DusB [Bacillota bacterium]